MDAVGSGTVQEKQKAWLEEIINSLNGLFEGELSETDQLVYVNGVIKGKMLEDELLVQQAMSNTKEQFANSPDLANSLMNAIMDALEAHTSMSSQALNSHRVREGIRDTLLGPGQLYEALRQRATGQSPRL
jgi:type I restriction enzyme R subunit